MGQSVRDKDQSMEAITGDVGLLKPREHDDPDDAHYDYTKIIVSYYTKVYNC